METTPSSITNLTDAELIRLIAGYQRELEKRAQHRATKRQRWVENWYYEFISHPNATFVRVGDATVVSVYGRNSGIRMGTARPVHGDEFNREVGIAVAYAKATGAPVPDYI